MIQLQNVSKKYHTQGGWTTVLKDVNLTLERGQKLGILGRNGAGKSTLIRLMSGAEPPSSGKIIRDMSISWPLAFSGGFQGSLTGIDNLKLSVGCMARIIKKYATMLRILLNWVNTCMSHSKVTHRGCGRDWLLGCLWR